MFDFNKIESARSITAEWVLSKVDEFTIFSYYFGDFKVGKRYPSKFRKDRDPSTGFYLSKGGKIIYNDFVTNEKLNCFMFVGKLYSLSFYESLNKIAGDFGLLEGVQKEVTNSFMEKMKYEEKDFKKSNLIQFSYQEWKKDALDFWRLYEISLEELIANEVYQVGSLYLNKREIYNPENTLRFAYPLTYSDEEFKMHNAVKIYSPKDKYMKWLSTIPNSMPFGTKELKFESDTLYITKSKKDHIVLKKLFTDVISVQNESENSFPVDLQERYLRRYEKCIIVFDNDDPGVDACKKFNTKGFGYFNVPREELERGIKDPSDYIKVYGEDALRELFKNKNLCPNIK